MRKIAIGLLLLTLTACGAASSPTGSDSTGSTGSTGSTAPSALPSASPAGGDDPVSGSPGTGTGLMPMGDLEKNVMTLLSASTSLPAENLTLQNQEEVEWPNGALGCPKDGMMYTEMIVPGYKLTFSDGSQTYEVHTDRTGQNVIWCDNGEPKPLVNP